MGRLYSLLRRHYLLLLALLAVAVMAALSSGSGVRFHDFELERRGGGTQAVELPFLVQGRGAADYQLRGEMHIGWFAPRVYNLVPDDQLLALTINGEAVDLSHLPAASLRDVNRGVTLNLAHVLHIGANQIEIRFRDFGGDMGMTLKRSAQDWRTLVLWLGWSLLLGGVLVALLRRLGFSTAHSVCYLLIVLGSLVQVWYIFTYNPVYHIFSDPARHWEQGIDVLRRDLMALTDPIGYQLYVAVLAKFTLQLPGLVAYCTSILALLAPWLWYRFFRELQSSKGLALAGWAFLSLLPSWTAIYGYFMQETLMLPLLGAALWATWRCRRKGDAASFGLMVFFWIAAGLTRGIAIPMAAVVCTWLWLGQDLKIKKALWSSLIMLAIMGPLTYRAYQTVGHFAPHGMGHLNVIYAQSGKKVIDIDVAGVGRWWFGSPSTGAQPFAPFSDWKTRRTGTVQVKVDLQEGMRDWQAAMDDVDMSWSDYLWITKESLIFLFFAESWPDNNMARFIDQAGSATRWIWAPLLLLIVLALIIDGRRFRGQWMLPAVIAAWFVVQALVPIAISEGRYRKPVEGLLVAQVLLWLAMRRGALRPTAASKPWLDTVRPYWRRLPLRNKTEEA